MTGVIYLTRHAEPLVVGGQKTDLTNEGRKQAEQLGRLLRKHLGAKVKVAVLHAESSRCKETADIIGEQLAARSVGAPLRFKNADNLKVGDAESTYSAYIDHHKDFGIESPEAYLRRLMRILEGSRKRASIIVANEVNIRVVLQLLGGRTYNTPVGHAACFKIDINDDLKSAAIERVA